MRIPSTAQRNQAAAQQIYVAMYSLTGLLRDVGAAWRNLIAKLSPLAISDAQAPTTDSTTIHFASLKSRVASLLPAAHSKDKDDIDFGHVTVQRHIAV